MDPAVFEAPDGSEGAPAPHGELILRTGRQSGTRRALNAPLTLLGSGPGCEIRLNVESVQPLHCALLVGPGGLVLRDLNTPEGTLVNGQRVASCTLRSGDLVQVGPFQFEAALPAAFSEEFTPAPVPRQAECDALHVQAAAVVAQQAALGELEGQLCQDRSALDRQQEQLAGHLEERRRQLLDLQDQVRQERADLQSEQAAVQEQQQKARAERKALHQELEQQLHAARKERARLVELRRRLKRRWKSHWTEHEQALARRDVALQGQVQQLAQARQAFDQIRLRLNGELELARRQFEEEKTGFRALQERWADYLNHERTRLSERWTQIEARTEELAQLERSLQGQQRQADETQSRLAREAAGLEARVEHLRARLTELTPAQGWWGVGSTAAAPLPGPEPLPAVSAERVEELERLAASLADQRLHLAEQWEAFAQAQQNWAAQHQGLLPELEAVARTLDERERGLRNREFAVEREWAALHQQHQVQSAWQTQLQGWQARLTLQESTWADERDAALERLSQREAVADRRAGILDRLRQRWAARRRQELAGLEEQWQHCQQSQRQYLDLWQECERRRQELHETQRGLAERALALQQLQIEVIGRSGDSAAAEKRLERLRKQWTAQQSQSEKALAQHRRAMQDEVVRLQAAAGRISQQAGVLLQREDEVTRREADLNQEQASAEDAAVRQEKEIERLHRLRRQSERQLRELRDEVERLVRLMLDETTAPSAAA